MALHPHHKSQSDLQPLPATGEQSGTIEQEILSDSAIQAEYTREYFRQLKRQVCPGCGDGDLFAVGE